MANFTTDGRITTQSALSRTLCGILSGALRISFITVPEFSTRSCSFFWAKAGRASTATNPRLNKAFFMISPLLDLEVSVNLDPPYLGQNSAYGPMRFVSLDRR